MSKYDDLFDDTALDDSVFADKGTLDPLAEPDDIVARDAQERELATTLNGVHEGYLPTTPGLFLPKGRRGACRRQGRFSRGSHSSA